MHDRIKSYFDGHPKVNTFYFTTDGGAFKEERSAITHGATLEKIKKGAGEVLTVTRAQVNEWWEEEVPKRIAAAEQEVSASEDAETTAQEAVESLTKQSTPSQKLHAREALEKATERLKNANANLKALHQEAERIEKEQGESL